MLSQIRKAVEEVCWNKYEFVVTEHLQTEGSNETGKEKHSMQQNEKNEGVKGAARAGRRRQRDGNGLTHDNRLHVVFYKVWWRKKEHKHQRKKERQ